MQLNDPALKAVLSPVVQGKSEAWDLLPYMLAACFFSNNWKAATYKPSVDGTSARPRRVMRLC